MIARAHNKELSDGDLMSAMSRGDMEPLGEIYQRYGGAVRSLLWRLLPGDTSFEAEDICHDVFMTVFDIADRFDSSYELRPWLFGIAVRKARSWSRKKWLREKLLRSRASENIAVGVQPASSDESIAIHHEVDKAMKLLPTAQREVLVLYVTNRMNGEQIAKSLGVPVNTVWTRLRRARIAMRDALSEMSGDSNKIGGSQ